MNKPIWSGYSIKRLASPTSQWFVAGLVVGLLVVLGIAVRKPVSNMAPIEGYWTPNVQYGTWYLARNHHLFPVTGFVPLLSNYTSGLNYGAVDFVHTFITGGAFILGRTSDVGAIGTAYQWLPWQGLVLVPLAALAVYNRWARSMGRAMQPAHVVILFLFVAFPTYQIIIWSNSAGALVPLGWALFFCLYLSLFAKAADSAYSWQWGAICTGAILLLQATYHTTAFVIAIILPTLWLVQRVFGKRYISSVTVQLGTVVFLSFLMYYAVTFWADYGRFAVHFLKDIYRSHDDQLVQYTLQSLSLHPLWYIINYLAVILPVAWVAWLALRSRRNRDGNTHTLALNYQLAWFVVLVPLAVLLFAWNGIAGAYARLLQYGCLLAAPAVAYLLLTRRNAVIPLGIAALTCLVISVTLLQIYPIASTNYITNDERESVEWIAAHQGCNNVIFTDFRIGSTFGYQGCFAVVGPTASGLSARNKLDVLTALLYQADPAALSQGLDAIQTTDHRSPTVALVSRRFLDRQTGFFMPDIRAQPMTEAQWQAYRSLPGWRISFENATTMVLARDETKH